VADRFIIAINVTVEGDVTKMGAIWTGDKFVTVRGKAHIFHDAEEAESKRFYLAAQYLKFIGKVEILKIEEGSERRYHLRGGEKIETE